MESMTIFHTAHLPAAVLQDHFLSVTARCERVETAQLKRACMQRQKAAASSTAHIRDIWQTHLIVCVHTFLQHVLGLRKASNGTNMYNGLLSILVTP